MIDYAAAKREMPKLKAKLTRAKNSKDPAKVLAVVQEALPLTAGELTRTTGVSSRMPNGMRSLSSYANPTACKP